MEKTKRKILFAILSFLFISIFTFALVEVLPTSASATTYTDEEQTNGLKIGVSDGGLWTVEDAPGKQKKYTAVANSATAPTLKITVQGEQYVSFEYSMPACTDALTSDNNYFTFDMDGRRYLKCQNDKKEELKDEYIIKTHGDGEHVIIIHADAATSGAAGMYWQNIQIRDISEEEKKPLKISYDATKESIYMIESANKDGFGDEDNEETLKKIATYIQPGQEYQLPVNTFFVLKHLSKEVVSSIDGETRVKMYHHPAHLTSETDDKQQLSNYGSTSPIQGYKITETGIQSLTNAYLYKSSFTVKSYSLKDECFEEAPAPTVFLYYDGEKHQLENDAKELKMPDGKDSVSLCIKSLLPDYESVYTVTGEGAEFSDWEEDRGVISRSVSLTREGIVTITIDIAYDETKYHVTSASKTFTFSYYTPSKGGLRDILAIPSAENITEIIDDETYPWKYDAARSDGGIAYSSGLLGKTGTVKSVSQIGFKVKGSGVLIFDLQIDGDGNQNSSTKKIRSHSVAGFHMDTPVVVSTSWGQLDSNKNDFDIYRGFNTTVASNLAYGMSNKSTHGHSNYPGGTVKSGQTSITDSNINNSDDHGIKLIEEGDGYEWYTVTIPIENKGETEETTVYLAHGVLTGSVITHMTVRNVGFYSNDTTAVSFEVGDGETSSVSNSKISVEANGKDITLDDDGFPKKNSPNEDPIGIGARLTLTAKPSEGEVFYGWQEVIGDKTKIVSYDATTDYLVMSEKVKIVAVIAPKGTIAVRNGGKFYKTANVQAAFDAASAGADKTVIAVDNVTLTGDLTVHTGVTFVIPYNADGEYQGEGKASNATPRVSWATDYAGNEKYRTPFLKVTLDTGAALTVNGNFYVGGVLHYPDQSAQGHTSGAYSEFVNDGTVTVKSGGVTDVCGRVTGKGSIDVQNGGKLYQPFMILDYSGGTNTQAMFDTANVTPFKMYSMVNIQCTGGYTIEYGGILFGHASLYFFSSITAIDQPFITYKDEGGNMPEDADSGLLIMKKGSTVKAVYDDSHTRVTGVENVADVGKTTMTINGDVEAGFMDFLGMVQTKDVNFALPYNYELEIASGNFTVANHFKVMPGAEVTVDSGATVTVKSGKSLHVYDSFYGPAFAKREYPTGAQLSAAGYKTYASLIVNGKFVVESNATFVGTVQTTGTTGEIDIKTGAKLSASLSDGVVTQYGCNYTKYTLKAQVWDSAHGAMADLKTGVYHAVKTTETWTLPGIKFEYESNTKHTSGAHSLQSLTTAEATGLVGSWMIEHAEDVYDWTPKADDRLPEGTLYKKITRICTALGCDHEAEKYLFSVPDSLGSIPFRNAAFASEDLELLFKNCFTKNAPDTFPADVTVKASEIGGDTKVGEYTVTVSLNDKGVWLDGDHYISTKQLKWSIAQLSLENGVGTATPSQSTTEYNGVKTEKLGVTVKAKGIAGDLKATTDYTVSYDGQDTTNVGTVIVTVTGTGNYTGTITCTYQITAKKVNLTLEKQTATYSGAKPEINGTKYKTTDILAGDEGNVAITLDITPKGDVWNVGSYDLTAKLSNTGGHENYVLGTVDGKNMFEITKAAVTVTVTAQHTTYNGKEQSFSGTWEAEGLVHEEQKSVLGVNLSAAGTAAKAYDVTASYNEQGNYTVKFVGCDGAFVIDALDISTGADIKAAACTYNGQAQEPTLTVTKDGLTLQLTTDYTAKYSNNTNAGAADVTVTATGNFKGTATTTFEIQKASVTVRAEDAHTAEGDELAADFDFTATSGTIYNDDKAVLKEFFKFTTGATKENAKAGQSFEITIDFKSEARPGNYEVTFDETKGVYYIDESVYKNVTYEDLTLTYNGQKQIFKVVTADLPGARVTLKPEGREEEFTGATDAKQYRVDVTISLEGHNDYKTTVTFEIKAKNIEGADIALAEADLTYTGEEIRPDVTKVSVGDLELKNGEYSVSYSSNTNAGEAMVTVTANQGNFTGTATTTFMIAARSIKDAAVTVAGSFTYNGREQTPDVTVTLQIGEKSVTLGKDDFVVKYENNRHAGAASVTVTGKGNYNESVENAQAFTIAAKPIAVTIREQQTVYTGKAPELQQNGDRWFTTSDAICEDDDLQITLKALAKGDKWGAGTYEIDGECANRDYAVTFTKGTLTIDKKAITVTITDKSSEYGAEYAELAWTVDEQALCTGDTRETLGITLAIKDKTDRLPAGAYKIEATTTAADYAVTFAGSWKAQAGEVAGSTYTVKKKAITITLQAQSSVYNNAVPAVGQAKDTAWKVTVGEILSGDELSVQLYLETPGKDVKADGYTIKGRYSNDNYDVTFVDGTYTITARPVTVKIADQEAVYDYTHKYAFNDAAWTLEGALAESEEKGVLNVALTKPELTDVGEYEIAGKWNNKNYAVTFAGTKGQTGVYTVKQKDVGDGTEDEAVFLLVVGEGGNTSEGERKLRVQMSGDSLHVVCTVTVYEGTDEKTLACKIDPAELKALGEQTVTVTIEDQNYKGSAVFTVVVTDAEGYTPEMREKLQQLETLAEGMDAEALKAEDFQNLKEINALLSTLSEEEREALGESLEPYDELVAAWHELADLDEIIETAEAIGNAPIRGLYEAAAVVSALAVLGYIVMKGGLL